MPEEKPSSDETPPPPANADEAEEAKRLENIKAAHTSHHVAGSTVRENLPQVHNGDAD